MWPILGLYLHHNFVAALLNDLFGIQCTVGSAFDSQYTRYLFGITVDEANKLDGGGGSKVMVPGFTRLDFAWFFNDDEVKPFSSFYCFPFHFFIR